MDDAGLYECQVSSTPPLSHHIYLEVAQPYTEIVGGKEIYLDEGSMMNITCLVKVILLIFFVCNECKEVVQSFSKFVLRYKCTPLIL